MTTKGRLMARKIELISGVATAILGLVVPLNLNGAISNMPPEYYRESLIEIIILFVCPGLLVAMGAYAHAVKQKPWGRKLLWVMGALYIIVSPILFLLGGYGGGWRQAFLVITPAVTAILSLVSSLGTQYDLRKCPSMYRSKINAVFSSCRVRPNVEWRSPLLSLAPCPEYFRLSAQIFHETLSRW